MVGSIASKFKMKTEDQDPDSDEEVDAAVMPDISPLEMEQRP